MSTTLLLHEAALTSMSEACLCCSQSMQLAYVSEVGTQNDLGIDGVLASFI